jgi:hypothetical protein
VAAVAQGGIITFNCGPAPVTIVLKQTARIFNNTGPKIVIDGGGAIFFVSNDRTGSLIIKESVLSPNPSEGFETTGYPGIYFLGNGSPQVTDSTIE